MLLMVCVLSWVNKQEETVSQELPGYHPHHSKPKCLHTTDPLKHRISSFADIQSSVHLNTHIHTKDYYVFTLEHILI